MKNYLGKLLGAGIAAMSLSGCMYVSRSEMEKSMYLQQDMYDKEIYKLEKRIDELEKKIDSYQMNKEIPASHKKDEKAWSDGQALLDLLNEEKKDK